MSRLGKFLLSGLGTGYLPLAPGSWGSAAAAGVFLAAAWASNGSVVWVNLAMALTAAGAAAVCVLFGEQGERHFGRKDAPQNTADEWAGQAVALLLLPLGQTWRSWLIVAGVSFFLFRLADCLKPPPLRRLEKLPFGWGVLMDDVLAGVYANIACQLLLRFWLKF